MKEVILILFTSAICVMCCIFELNFLFGLISMNDDKMLIAGLCLITTASLMFVIFITYRIITRILKKGE